MKNEKGELYAKEKLQVYETNKIQSSLIPNIK
jgi:hypothetical protein